ADQPVIPTPRVYVKSDHVDVPANGFVTAVLRCDAGDFALGGGYSHPTDTVSFAHVGDSFPVLTDGKPTAWEVDVDVDSSHTTSQPVDLYATCLDATP